MGRRGEALFHLHKCTLLLHVMEKHVVAFLEAECSDAMDQIRMLLVSRCAAQLALCYACSCIDTCGHT